MRRSITCFYDERKEDKTFGECDMGHETDGNWKPEGKEWWVDQGIDGISINIMLTKLGGGYEGKIALRQGRERWRAVVITVMNSGGGSHKMRRISRQAAARTVCGLRKPDACVISRPVCVVSCGP